jgi:hypothetical protein
VAKTTPGASPIRIFRLAPWPLTAQCDRLHGQLQAAGCRSPHAKRRYSWTGLKMVLILYWMGFAIFFSDLIWSFDLFQIWPQFVSRFF